MCHVQNTHTPTLTESQAETYGRMSEPLHMDGALGDRQDIRLGEPMSILASRLVARIIFQSAVNVFRCHRYGQIIWQEVCVKWGERESVFGWDPDRSGGQKWQTSYWMRTRGRRQILFSSTANDKQLWNRPDGSACEFPHSLSSGICDIS